MSKVLIRASEGSDIQEIISDDESLDSAFVEIGDKQPVIQEVSCQPDLIQEYVSKLEFCADDLPPDEEVEE